MQTELYAKRWWALGALCLSLVVIGMDNTILNVALPTLSRDLGATASQLQWMVDAYVLVFAGLLLTMGALGDRFGRKKALNIGLTIFGLGSIASAFSGSASMLIAMVISIWLFSNQTKYVGVVPSAHPKFGDLTFEVGFVIAAAIAFELLRNSRISIAKFGLKFWTGKIWDPVSGEFGAFPFLWGTLYSSILALLVAGPVAIGIAVFLSELAPHRMRRPLAFLTELLAAIPSIVYGLWGVFVLVPLIRRLEIGMPDSILLKPAALTVEEFETNGKKTNSWTKIGAAFPPQGRDRIFYRTEGLPH